MSDNSRAFVKALFGFDAVVQRVRSEEWSRASPCDGWDATEIVNHTVLVIGAIEEMTRGNSAAVPATGTPGEFPTFHGDDHVFGAHVFAAPRVGDGQDPAEFWAGHRDRFLEALDRPGALEQRARSPWGHETVDEFLGFAFYDPLLHSWDLAQAVGQSIHLDRALVERALGVIGDPGDGRDLYQPASLASPVPTDSTNPSHQLLAMSGRDPGV